MSHTAIRSPEQSDIQSRGDPKNTMLGKTPCDGRRLYQETSPANGKHKYTRITTESSKDSWVFKDIHRGDRRRKGDEGELK